jgi:hypothetical protein
MKTSLKILKVSAITLITTITLITACKKDSSSSSTPTTDNNGPAANLSANGATSDNAFDDAFNIAMQTGNDKGLDNLNRQQKSGAATLGYTVTGAYYCATVTVKPTAGTTFPDTLIVDFGTGCTSTDNITRSGSITYIFSGHLSVPGTTVSATFNNYVVNGYALTGAYSITNSTTNINSPSLTTAVTGGSITYPNDTSYSFSGSKTVTLVSGSISDISTLVFNITGGYSISDSYGESLTATVSTPLERKETCLFVDKGITSFKYTKGSASVNGTLDYGDGTCDNSALITIGSFTETVTIP